MNTYILGVFVAGLLLCSGCFYAKQKNTQASVEYTSKLPKTSFYDLKALTIDGKEQSMSEYKGKFVLIVNVASKCGFTPQYADLEKLFEQYKDKLVILGFPANNFLWQEPASNEQIHSFCSLKYHVTFPMFAKISVRGSDISPVYQWLIDPKKNGWNSAKPFWNFNKYLISPEGILLAHFGSKVPPLSTEITSYFS